MWISIYHCIYYILIFAAQMKTMAKKKVKQKKVRKLIDFPKATILFVEKELKKSGNNFKNFVEDLVEQWVADNI